MTIIRLDDADRRCGPKAAHLGSMRRAGFHVPDGLVVLDPSPAARLRTELRRLGDVPVAVRSSALTEDTAYASFAGQFLTILGVRGTTQVTAAVARCAQSGPRADGRAPSGSGTIPVIVQRLVAAETSGVLFTEDPLTGQDRAVINATWGLGEPLVQGAITPDTVYVSDGVVTQIRGSKHLRHDLTADGVVVSPTAPQQQGRLCLTSAQAQVLARAGRDLEALFDGPQDIEWAFTGDTLWILQSRPITTTAPRAAGSSGNPQPPLVRGIGASPGTAIGPVRLLRGPQDFPTVTPGDVLVCHATDPTWTPLFRLAGGIITETGGILCHAAILAREVGIPAVVGAARACTTLVAGDSIAIDGTAGTATRTYQ